MIKTIFLPLLLLSSIFVHAQIDNTYLFNPIRPTDSLSNEVHFNFYNFNFVRNYEYSNFFHDGYTLYGTQMEPSISYYPNGNLAISAGAYLRKDYGSNGLYDTKPLFNVVYSKKDLTLIFGSLEGNIQQAYLEPLYNFDGKIQNPIQYGTQLIVNKEKYNINSWIAWQKMIYRGDVVKEEIAGGFTANIQLINQNNWHIKLPLQTYMMHRGGQIDVLKNIPIATYYAGALGLEIARDLNSKTQWYINNYWLSAKDLSPTKLNFYQGGSGYWANMGFKGVFGNFALAYWHGNRFTSVQGMPLFQSASHTLDHTGYTENQRDLLFFKYNYQKELLPNFYLDVRFEPHWDLNNKDKSLQFNHSFFLTYKENFKLFKLKNK